MADVCKAVCERCRKVGPLYGFRSDKAASITAPGMPPAYTFLVSLCLPCGTAAGFPFWFAKG